MKRTSLFVTTLVGGLLLPTLAHAQTNQGVANLHDVLQKVYDKMSPMCENLLQLSQAIGAIGVTFFIGFRVWKHIARAEAIDFFPLFRPFVMILLIGIFPLVLDFINAVLKPSVTATAAMVQHSNDAVNALLIAEAAQVGVDTSSVVLSETQGFKEDWDKYSQPTSTNTDGGGGVWSAIGSGFKFIAGGFMNAFKFIFRLLMSVLLEVLYFAASLCIDTLRTFHMIVLAVLGPLALAFSCYDGFQQSLTHWLGRYINIYLWLPVANLLGAILGNIQAEMLKMDLTNLQNGTAGFFSPTDLAYLIFLVIGIIGYTTVPGLANYIVHVHGPNPLMDKVGRLAGAAVSAAVGGGAGGAAGAAGSGASSAGAAGASASAGPGAQYMSGATSSAPNQYNRDKIGG